MAEVRQWYVKEDIGALKQQTGFYSYVAPSSDHELRVDLFQHTFKQPDRLKVKPISENVHRLKEGREWLRKVAEVEPYCTMARNSLTKEMHKELIKLKFGGAGWRPAMQKTLTNLETQGDLH